ncbi:MAG: NAD(P)H-dependent oxidoreductase subunit E [Chloroflexi bacterium]|nr:NAD(P)H-dependent oxidoreductase subunit E [Chloroflexota bacterium]MBI4505863.1 NAD(P)H-dependent oxidoreductase subunit E [Chloroflexota bacterium]
MSSHSTRVAPGEPDAAAVRHAVRAIAERHRETDGALMPVLHEVQQIHRWLPRAAIRAIAEELRMTPAEVYGVASFYHMFRLTPPGRTILTVCRGPACRVNGGATLVEEVQLELDLEAAHGATTPDGEFTLETSACLGICPHAPAVQIEHDLRGRVTVDDLLDLIRRQRGY